MSKQLYRLKKNKMIGGVSVGLADYFDIDPVIVRALFVILTLAWGIGFITYIVLWIIVPEKIDETENIYNTETDDFNFNTTIDEDLSNLEEKKNSRRLVGGIVLIILGIMFFLHELFPNLDFDFLWPIGLIAIGGYLIYRSYFMKKRSSI